MKKPPPSSKGKRQHWQFSPNHIISFGKHAGKKWSEVPSDYLEWFASNAYGQMVNRRKWAIEELKRRAPKDDK